MSSSSPVFKKKVWQPVFMGVGFAVLALALGEVAFALIVFLTLSSAGWIVANAKERTIISFFGVAAVIAGAAYLVVAAETKIEYWYIAKIAFVIYFGIFAGHLITKFTGDSDGMTIITLLSLMFVCFLIRLANEPGIDYLPYLKSLHDGGIYKWADFIEDAAFGLAGALAAELYGGQLKSSTGSTATGPTASGSSSANPSTGPDSSNPPEA